MEPTSLTIALIVSLVGNAYKSYKQENKLIARIKELEQKKDSEKITPILQAKGLSQKVKKKIEPLINNRNRLKVIFIRGESK